MSCGKAETIVEATDLSPICGIDDAQEAWLRVLARNADGDSLKIRLSRRDREEVEPVVSFDERTGCWWTGRYVGELEFQGRTLRILPRFGMPNLQRWLSKAWGIRPFTTKGRYETSRTWLWELLARVWEARLLTAAKHGLPTRRLEESYRGPTARGRLEVRPTAKEIGAGRQNLVTRTRNRHIDRRIGGIILCAFECLSRELHPLGDGRAWLTSRTQSLITELRSTISKQGSLEAIESGAPVRYTPITETYRPSVLLSLAIIRQHPFSPARGGASNVIGVLIDMAEIWELYLYHLLRAALEDVEVLHVGSSLDPKVYLLQSTCTGEYLGLLKPDIVIRSVPSRRCLCVLDAKYKVTSRMPDRPYGVVREDLYQMAAYLSAHGHSCERVSGGLVYPVGSDAATILGLQAASPWKLPATDRQLSFLAVKCITAPEREAWLTEDERAFVDRVRGLLGFSQA